MRRLFLPVVVLLVSLSAPARGLAAPISINFDSLADLDSVTTQFGGVVFSNATVLSAGSSLNEFEFPPHSGANVVFDDGGALSLAFLSPVSSFGGFFTYVAPLTLTAFDSSNNVLGSIQSAFLTNLALSGDAGSTPNEFLQLAFGTGISSILVSGSASGGSFTLDDATFDTVQPTPVPEPGTIWLVGLGAAAVLHKLRRQRV